MISYKGYSGTVRFDDESEILHGEVLGLRDVDTFHGTTVQELKRAFEESVED
jgi:predicted HicB family RNase H-like nuclease